MKPAVIERGRAKFALDAVKAVVSTADRGDTPKKYKSYARKFPSLVLTNGLAAAVAFAHEKAYAGQGIREEAWANIYNNVSEWLKHERYFGAPEELLAYVCRLDSDTYRLASNEVLALCEWLRRFASGLIEGEADGD